MKNLDDLFLGGQSSVFLAQKFIDKPSAWVGHIPFAQWLMSVMRPSVFVELGTHYGHSFFAFCNAASEHNIDTKLYAVDTWEGDEHAGVYGNEVYEAVAKFCDDNFSCSVQLMKMTFDEANGKFNEGSIDLLHIDGLHTYVAVKHDFNTWLPKMSERGVILFHDIEVREKDFGVWRLWSEVKARYPSIEFLNCNGLGVLFVGDKIDTKLVEWLKRMETEEYDGFFKHVFTSVGRVGELKQLSELRLDVIENSEAKIDSLEQNLKMTRTSYEEELKLKSRELGLIKEEILQKNVEIARQSSLIDSLEKNLKMTRISHKEELEFKSRDLSNLKEEILKRDVEIACQNSLIGELQGQKHRAEKLLEAVYTSTSWRVLEPVRRLVVKYKRIRTTYSHERAIRIAKKAIISAKYIPIAISEYGVRGLSNKILAEYKTNGASSLLRSIERYSGQGTAPILPEVVTDLSFKREQPGVVQRKSIVYVVNEYDLMTQEYRVRNYAEELIKRGYQVYIVKDGEVKGNPTLEKGGLLILNRIVLSEPVRILIDIYKNQRKPVIFDIDDLVFSRDHLEHIPHYGSLDEEQKQGLVNLVEGLSKTMRLSDYVTVSTHALRVEVEKLGKAAYVLPNNNGVRQQEIAKNLLDKKVHKPSDKLTIGYLSGTKTHDKDFAQCAEAVVSVMETNQNVEMLFVGEISVPEVFSKFSERVRKVPLMVHDEMLETLSTIDINLAPLTPNSLFTDCKSELKVFEAAMFNIPTVASPAASLCSVIHNGVNGYLASSAWQWREAINELIADEKKRKSVGELARKQIGERFSITSTIQEAVQIYESAISGNLKRKPNKLPTDLKSDEVYISIVSILYNKANEVRYFLEGLVRQDFPGGFEVVFVDDNSPDNSVDVVEDFLAWNKHNCNRDVHVKIIRNKENLGNCESRNVGIDAASGEIVIVVDADCMFNRTFLSEHYTAHSAGDCDVAIGPINIETNESSPLSVLACHDASAQLAAIDSKPQDPINLDSFVNCITRNFSINKSFLHDKITDKLFDNDFTYSADPKSGFGWEDVEMGCKVYGSGGRIKYMPNTASIHVSHPSSAKESEKPVRSLRNFKRLFEKHPSLILEARQWSVYTFNAISGWGESVVGGEFRQSEDYKKLEPKFRKYHKAPIVIDRARKLKILTHRWHVPHQYELYRLGHEITLVTGTGTAICDSWEFDKRPLPENAKMVHVSQINPSDYDLAIMHFDENILNPGLCKGFVPDDWGNTFDWFVSEVDLPKVAICHGTPQFYGQYDESYNYGDLGVVIEEERRRIVDYMSQIPVVTNSYQARSEWGFCRSQVIWHGFSPHDYPKGSNDQGVVVMLEAALRNRPHYNGFKIYKQVKNRLKPRVKLHYHKTPEPPNVYQRGSAEWAISKYQNYVREIGRYGVYFNPTVRSPMPRSRGEAMMAGLVSVSLRTHDVDLFINNGINGYYADTADELADYILWLQRNQRGLEKMSSASRNTALDIFNQDRYLSEWSSLLNTLVK